MTGWQEFQQLQRAHQRRRWEILRNWGRTAHDHRLLEQAERELERIEATDVRGVGRPESQGEEQAMSRDSTPRCPQCGGRNPHGTACRASSKRAKRSRT